MANTNQRTVAASEKIAQSAEVLKDSSVQQTDSADRRTELAANRTVLAAERTYAPWGRTGLAALAAGVGAQALLEDVVTGWLTRPTGSALVLFSGFCFVAAVWRELRPGAPPPRPDTRRLPAILLLAINGFLAFVSLMALIGIWVTSALDRLGLMAGPLWLQSRPGAAAVSLSWSQGVRMRRHVRLRRSQDAPAVHRPAVQRTAPLHQQLMRSGDGEFGWTGFWKGFQLRLGCCMVSCPA